MFRGMAVHDPCNLVAPCFCKHNHASVNDLDPWSGFSGVAEGTAACSKQRFSRPGQGAGKLDQQEPRRLPRGSSPRCGRGPRERGSRAPARAPRRLPPPAARGHRRAAAAPPGAPPIGLVPLPDWLRGGSAPSQGAGPRPLQSDGGHGARRRAPPPPGNPPAALLGAAGRGGAMEGVSALLARCPTAGLAGGLGVTACAAAGVLLYRIARR